MNRLLVSPAPHIHAAVSTKSLMRDVVIALLPAVIVSVVFYGLGEIVVLGTSVVSCILVEYLITKFLLKKPSTVCDYSAVVTGILLALNLPYTTPWWVVFIGALFAVGVVKMTFGGLGQNIFNPAIAGRVFLLVSFPAYMTNWQMPGGLFGVDAVSGATPLGLINEGIMNGQTVPEIMSANGLSYSQMLFANIGGSVGEISALALLAGFVYLLVRKVIRPHITLSIWATVALVSLVFWLAAPDRFTDPLFNLLSGGMILGSCFMATDYVTAPQTPWGRALFGIGAGLLTCLIRFYGSYAEGVSFAILFMNILTPYLSKWTASKPFGGAKA